MTCYSVQPRDWKFVKGYGFLSFARNTGKNTCKNLRSKYSQTLLDLAKQSAADALKTDHFKRRDEKNKQTAEATGDLIGNKVTDKITRVSKTSPKNNSETNEEEMLRERCISLKERQIIIDDLRLYNNNMI